MVIKKKKRKKKETAREEKGDSVRQRNFSHFILDNGSKKAAKQNKTQNNPGQGLMMSTSNPVLEGGYTPISSEGTTQSFHCLNELSAALHETELYFGI